MSFKLVILSILGGGGRGRFSSSDILDMLLSKAELSGSSLCGSVSFSVCLLGGIPSTSNLHESISLSCSCGFLDKLFLTALRRRVPPAPSPTTPPPSTSSSSWSDSLTRPQVVLVRGRRGVAAGRFLIVPPKGKSLSNPSSVPDLSLRHPLLEEDRDEREKDRRSLKLLSNVPTGVSPDTRSIVPIGASSNIWFIPSRIAVCSLL